MAIDRKPQGDKREEQCYANLNSSAEILPRDDRHLQPAAAEQTDNGATVLDEVLRVLLDAEFQLGRALFVVLNLAFDFFKFVEIPFNELNVAFDGIVQPRPVEGESKEPFRSSSGASGLKLTFNATKTSCVSSGNLERWSRALSCKTITSTATACI